MIRKYTATEIVAFEKQLRTNFINSLPGIRPANLIGTVNAAGVTNLAIFNSVMHIGANPPLMGFILRPADIERHTYQNIKQNGFYTINHVHEQFYKKAHQTAARYQISEFEATHLNTFYSDNFIAPYVKESVVKIGLQFEEEQLIKSNKTILVIGSVKEIIIDDSFLNEDFIVQLDQTKSLGVNGLETYYSLNKLEQLAYAKP